MIFRYTTAGVVVDAAALFAHFERRFSLPTIRKHCKSIGADEGTGIKLYDLEAAEEAMSGVRPRNPHRRPAARKNRVGGSA